MALARHEEGMCSQQNLRCDEIGMALEHKPQGSANSAQATGGVRPVSCEEEAFPFLRDSDIRFLGPREVEVCA